MPKGVSIKVQSNTALVLEIGCRFGYLTAIQMVTVYNTTFLLSLGSTELHFFLNR